MKKILSALALCPLLALASVTSRDVTIQGPGGKFTLAGTLTSPSAGAPRGAVLLVSGSGAQNRDEEVMGHRPFKAIAEDLSEHGYAVLRMDDRGTGASGGDFKGADADDFVEDTAVCLAFLDSCYSAIPRGIIGHSEGGLVAVKSAVANPRCNFIITLGGPAWRGDSIIMSQTRAIAVAMTGRWDGEPVQRQILNTVMLPVGKSVITPVLWRILSEQTGEAADMPQVKKVIETQVETLSSPWYRKFVAYDPAPDIAAVTVPYTAIIGEKDTQVLPANLETVKALNPHARTVLLPGLNHLLLKCGNGLVSEYATLTGDIDPAALDAIRQAVDFSVKNCKK